MKDVNDVYNAQESHTRSLICGQKIMEEVFAKKVGSGTTVAHYFYPANVDNVPTWDEEYKQQTMSQFIAMLADMKPTQAKIEELLSLGQQNPFDIMVDQASALVINNVTENQRINNMRQQGTK